MEHMSCARHGAELCGHMLECGHLCPQTYVNRQERFIQAHKTMTQVLLRIRWRSASSKDVPQCVCMCVCRARGPPQRMFHSVCVCVCVCVCVGRCVGLGGLLKGCSAVCVCVWVGRCVGLGGSAPLL